MEPLLLPIMGLKVPLVFFLKDGFAIKLPTKVDISFYKETKFMHIIIKRIE